MKDIKPSEIKTFTINGVEYAKYHIDTKLNVLFLKVTKTIIAGDVGGTENLIATIISGIENKSFKGLSYLNV